MRFSELCSKEVVSALTGVRLGFVDDMEIDGETAQVKKLIIGGRSEWLGLAGRGEDTEISWEDIEMVGSDVILVRIPVEKSPVSKKRWFWNM